MYSKGQQVKASVKKTFPFGVFVTLEDGMEAYIRCRELTLSGDLDPREILSVGQEIEASVIDLPTAGHLLELSIRDTLPDPWLEFSKLYKLGDVLIVTVKALASDRVYVEVKPGIDGFIPLNELSITKFGSPDELIWVDDHLEAVITSLDAKNKRLQLSIRGRIRELERRSQTENVLNYLKSDSQSIASINIGGPESISPLPLEIKELSNLKLDSIGAILVLEGEEGVRDPLIKWLSGMGGLVQSAKTTEEALKLCQNQSFRLVFVDLDLPGSDSLNLLKKIRQISDSGLAAVIGVPDEVLENLSELQNLKIAAVFIKPLDLKEIQIFLERILSGENPLWSPETKPEESDRELHPFYKLAGVMRSGKSIEIQFQKGLEQLTRGIQSGIAIVFHIDPATGKISIVSRKGDLPLNLNAIYGLVDSPVKNVILYEKAVWENRVLSEQRERFKKLLDLLNFESVLGVPIQAGGRCEYALFLFHRQPDSIDSYRQRDIIGMALLFSVALESHILDERILSLSRVFLNGQLAAASSHEIANKLSSMDLQFNNLHNEIRSFARSRQDLINQPDFVHFQEHLDLTIETTQNLKSTIEGFRRLMEVKEEKGPINVNTIIYQAKQQLLLLARRVKVEIHLDLDEDLPSIIGSIVAFQQVFLNIMLNAIQHMEKQPDVRRTLVIVSSHKKDESKNEPIEIRFRDTGPGIHKSLWEKIFTLGFTTRSGGSGLGLYIAQSLVEAMGGQIMVEESLISIGTTFLVKLPAESA